MSETLPPSPPPTTQPSDGASFSYPRPASIPAADFTYPRPAPPETERQQIAAPMTLGQALRYICVSLAVLLVGVMLYRGTAGDDRPAVADRPVVVNTASAQSESLSSNRNSRDVSGFVGEIKAVAPNMGSASRSDIIALGDDVCDRYERGESTVSIVNIYGGLARSNGFPASEASAFVAFAPIFLCPDADVG